MNVDPIRAAVPHVLAWIRETLVANSPHSRPILDYRFPRIPSFYPARLLEEITVVEVDRVPFPPLRALGLLQFADLEHGEYSGITFGSTYFVRRDRADQEEIHFHELIHVVQWRELGEELFLLAYAAGFLEAGYERSPLEAMAFALQADFSLGVSTFECEKEVKRRLATLSLKG